MQAWKEEIIHSGDGELDNKQWAYSEARNMKYWKGLDGKQLYKDKNCRTQEQTGKGDCRVFKAGCL